MPRIPYSKRADGRYYKQICIGYDEAGKKKVKTLYDRDWRELDKKVREFQVNFQQGKYIEKDITLGECIDLWWQTKVNLSESSKNTYRSNLKKISHLSHIKMKNLKPMHFNTLYNNLYKSGAKTLASTMPVLIKNIFDFAVSNNFIENNIVSRISIPKLKRNKRRALNKSERIAVNKALDHLSLFQKALVGLFLYTGMRRNEILALKVKDINLDEGYIDVNRTITFDRKYIPVEKASTKTQAGVRKIPILHRLKPILEEYLKHPNFTDEHLFLTNRGKLIDSGTFNYYWKKILKVINDFMPNGETTDVTPHYFRHNFATDLVYAGIPLKTVQYIMGHENISVTMDIYADIREDKNNTIDKMENYLNDMSIQF